MELEDLFLDEKTYIRQSLTEWASVVDRHTHQDTREVMAQILSNQKRYQENWRRYMESDQTTGTVALSVFPTKVVYPLIDQIFPELFAMQIAQVKPLRQSTGRVVFRTYNWSDGDSAFAHTLSGAETAEVGTVPLARMKLTSSDISTKKYSLRARYSLETIEDCIADGINFESEMIAALRDEIIGELDYLVIRELFNSATADAVSYSTVTHSGETVKEHQEELWDAIVDASNNIYTKTNRGANFIVGNPAAIGRLEKLTSFGRVADALGLRTKRGALMVGSLGGEYDLYKSTNAPANKLLVGTAKEGYLFCPYIPLELTPVDYKDETEELGRGVRTRFGTKVISGDYYSVITIS